MIVHSVALTSTTLRSESRVKMGGRTKMEAHGNSHFPANVVASQL